MHNPESEIQPLLPNARFHTISVGDIVSEFFSQDIVAYDFLRNISPTLEAIEKHNQAHQQLYEAKQKSDNPPDELRQAIIDTNQLLPPRLNEVGQPNHQLINTNKEGTNE